MKIIDRYVIKELFDPFIFVVTAFTLILSASMVMFELVRAVVIMGMPMHIAAQIFLFKLPSVVVYIFPMAMLLASILAFARFSSDKEIIAFRAGGVSLYRIMVPVLSMGLAVSFLTLAFYEIVVPEANHATKRLLIETKIEKAPKIRENVFIPELERGQLKRIFYARKSSGNKMSGVIIQEFNDGQLSQLINAKTAEWDIDRWIFRNGTTYFLSDEGEYRHLIRFDEQHIVLKLTPADLNVAQLYDGFTFLTIAWLEALGICADGDVGPFVEGGARIARDGELPLNTYGGQLSAGRMHGYWALHEGCLQLRGEAGERQVAQRPEVGVVSVGGGPVAGCMLLTC